MPRKREGKVVAYRPRSTRSTWRTCAPTSPVWASNSWWPGRESGVTTLADIEAAVDEETACVLVQHPNFFGCLEDVEGMAEIAHRAGALLVQVFDPISLGLLKTPGQLGADIAVAEGQSLCTNMQFGGPYLGIMAWPRKICTAIARPHYRPDR